MDWTAWRNDGASQNRLMIFDSSAGGGIRMSPEQLTIDDLKQRLFSDSRFQDQAEYCEAYKSLFTGQYFVQSEYDSLGNGGCS